MGFRGESNRGLAVRDDVAEQIIFDLDIQWDYNSSRPKNRQAYGYPITTIFRQKNDRVALLKLLV